MITHIRAFAAATLLAIFAAPACATKATAAPALDRADQTSVTSFDERKDVLEVKRQRVRQNDERPTLHGQPFDERKDVYNSKPRRAWTTTPRYGLSALADINATFERLKGLGNSSGSNSLPDINATYEKLKGLSDAHD